MEAGAAEAQERAEAAGQTGGESVHQGGEGQPPGVPEDARRAPEKDARTVLSEAREKLEEEGSFLEAMDEETEAATETLEEEDTEEPDISPVEEETQEERSLEIPESDMLPEAALPDGWSYDANNRLHRKDGTMASLQDHETLRREFEKGLEAADADEGPQEPDVEETADDPESPDLTVELPGRQPDETVKVTAADEETAERLRQLRNDAMRREEFKRQKQSLDQDRQQFRELEAEFKADPSRFLAKRVEDPELREKTVLRLLGQDEETFNRVQSTLRQWDMNPDKKRADLAEMENEARDRKQETTREQRVREQARNAATQARSHVEDLAREAGLEGVRAKKFMKTAMREVGDAMVDANRFEISRDEAIQVLEHTGTLEAFGATPGASRGRSSSRRGADNGKASERRVRAVDPDSEAARKARRAGEEMKSEAESRRAAAASPQGAGASAAQQVTPPEGQSVKERIAWAKEKGLGTILSGQ